MTRLPRLSFLNRFLAREEGNISIEMILWVPVLVGLLMMTADATFLLYRQTLLFDAARDASRQVALGLRTPEDARDGAIARFSGDGGHYTADVALQDGYVTSEISVPFSDVLAFNGIFTGTSMLTASVSMWIETEEE